MTLKIVRKISAKSINLITPPTMTISSLNCLYKAISALFLISESTLFWNNQLSFLFCLLTVSNFFLILSICLDRFESARMANTINAAITTKIIRNTNWNITSSYMILFTRNTPQMTY